VDLGWRDGRADSPLSRRRALWIGGVFVVAVFAWALLVALLEAALGVAPRLPVGIALTPNVLDTVWHLATAFLLVIPVRDRRLWVAGPVMSLGLNVDHLFGYVLPTPFGRLSHNLLFVVSWSVAAAAVFGRTGAAMGSGAALAEIAVDGGNFPLFAPLTTHMYSLTYLESVGLVFLAAWLFFVSLRPLHDLRRPRTLAIWVASAAALSVVLRFIPPGFAALT
jgi:hypothetical protein